MLRGKVRLKETFMLFAFGVFKIPLLAFIRLRVIESNREGCCIRVPYRKRNSNHVNSLYFGVLSSAADVAAGWLIINELNQLKGKKSSFVFQSSEAQFLRRATADTDFFCMEGEKVRQTIAEAVRTKERISVPLAIEARSYQGDTGVETVATFQLVASIKVT